MPFSRKLCMSAPRALVTTSLSYKVNRSETKRKKWPTPVFVMPRVLQTIVVAHRSLVWIGELQSKVGDKRAVTSRFLPGSFDNINKPVRKQGIKQTYLWINRRTEWSPRPCLHPRPNSSWQKGSHSEYRRLRICGTGPEHHLCIWKLCNWILFVNLVLTSFSSVVLMQDWQWVGSSVILDLYVRHRLRQLLSPECEWAAWPLGWGRNSIYTGLFVLVGKPVKWVMDCDSKWIRVTIRTYSNFYPPN